MAEHGRWRRLADLLREGAEGSDVGGSVAAVVAELLGVDEVSLAAVADDVPTTLVGTSDAAVRLCERSFVLGDGPPIAAHRAGAPVIVPDVTRIGDMVQRVGSEVGAIFAYPLRLGGAAYGVMTAHRARPGPLGPTESTDALIVASLVTIVLLQAEVGAALGDVTVSYDPLDEMNAALHDLVQIAAGITAERLRIPIVEALVRMRAHAVVEELSCDLVPGTTVVGPIPVVDGMVDPADLPTSITAIAPDTTSIAFTATQPVAAVIVVASPPVLHEFAPEVLEGAVDATVTDDPVDLYFCVRPMSDGPDDPTDPADPADAADPTDADDPDFGILVDPSTIPTGGGPSGRTTLALVAFVVLALAGSMTLLLWSRGVDG